MTPEQVNEIIARSENGEGVVNVLREMGLPVDDSLEELKAHHQRLQEAKKVWRAKQL
jgi:coenzyme F420-reducing hydrogenase beta subunit